MTEYERIRELETRRWAELQATYLECVKVVESVWADRIAVASAQQQALAEAMRDRCVPAAMVPFPAKTGAQEITTEGEIHVPLFTPRDRLQFLKEAAVAMLISADRRNLTVTLPHAPEVPFGPHKGLKLADLDTETLTGARDWAVDKAPAKFPDFILEANAELNRRVQAQITQPLDAKPLALVNAGDDDEDFRGTSV